jgi:hypothetical protein
MDSVEDDGVAGSPAASESWQVLAALSSLRAGSASLFSSAAHQLRLRQQGASKTAGSGKGPSHLSNMSRGAAAAAAVNGVFADAPASPAGTSRQFSRFAGQPGSSERESGYCRQQQLMRWQEQLQQQKQEEQQQQEQHQAVADTVNQVHNAVDFLDRFTVNFMAVNFGGSTAAVGQGTLNRWSVPSRRESMRVDTPTTPAGTPLAAAGSFGSCSSTTLATLQQHQLAVTYVQQPPAATPQQQAAAASNLSAPEDTLTVFLAHLKVTVGPHTVSMLLQLLTSVSAAASMPRGSSSRAAGSRAYSRPRQRSAAAGTSASSKTAGRPASSLHMQLQAALCHVRVNMERPYWLDMSKAEKKARAARDKSEKQKAEQHQNRDAELEQPDTAQQYQIDDTPMRTKELLAILVLGTSTSVRKVHAAAPSSSRDADSAAAAAADNSPVIAQPGMEVAFSVAHIGLQDLRACVEQRHVLSGALEPYQVRLYAACVPPGCHVWLSV